MRINKKKIVILGAGIEQLEAYKISKKLGLVVIGVDKNSNAPAFEIADYNINISIKNTDTIIAELKKYCPIHGVFTLASDFPVSVSKIANKFKIKAIPIKSALNASNKILMKKKFKKFKIDTPKFCIIKNFTEFRKRIKKFNQNIIIKPSDNCGSRGVFLLDKNYNYKKLKYYFEKSLKFSSEKKILLETFLEGPQISTEGLFIKNKYKSICFADRNYSGLYKTKPFILEDGGSIPSAINKKMQNSIDYLINKACHALNINQGTIKGDLVIFKNKPYIIELAARISGGYMATHSIPLIYDFNLLERAIKQACDIPVSDKINLKPKKKFLCQRYFFCENKYLSKIKGIKYLRKNKNIKHFEIYAKPGQKLKKVQSHAERSGMIIALDNSYKLAQKKAEDAIKKIKFIYQ